MRVVCYAVNGSGIGHLKRLIGVARRLRLYAAESAVPLEIYFLTSSEASHLLFAENFASFKFPSREALVNAGIETADFTKIAKQWAAQTLKLLKPDLLLVDTFPSGYYDELTQSLSLCEATAVILRPLKFDNLDQKYFYETLARYDSIIVAESETESNLPIEIQEKTDFFGAIMCREKDELLDRQSARRKLNVKDEDFLIYLSAGGGGDKQAEDRIHYLYQSLCDLPNLQFVIGAGALYHGPRIYAPNVVWLTSENAFELMPAFDAAVSAAGYNSFHELLYAGVPTIFIPQKKWADDQFVRAGKAVRTGAALLSEKLPEIMELRDLIEVLRDEKTRSILSQNAEKFVPVNYASQIAKKLFENFLLK